MTDIDTVTNQVLLFFSSSNRDYGNINTATKILNNDLFEKRSKGARFCKVSLCEFNCFLDINNINSYNNTLVIFYYDLRPDGDHQSLQLSYTIPVGSYDVDSLLVVLNGLTTNIGRDNSSLVWTFDNDQRKYIVTPMNAAKEVFFEIHTDDVANSINNILGFPVNVIFYGDQTITAPEPVNLSTTTTILLGLNLVNNNVICYPKYSPDGKKKEIDYSENCNIIARIPVANIPIGSQLDFSSIYGNHTFNTVLDVTSLRADISFDLLDENYRPLQLASDFFVTLKYEFIE